MPIRWNAQADVKLFINVLNIHNIKIDYNALADAMGENVTAKAITHRISKLRQIAAEEGSTPASESSAVGAVATIPKRARGAATKAAKATTPKKGAATAPNEGGPKKRTRNPRNVKKELPSAMAEDNHNNNSDDNDNDDEISVKGEITDTADDETYFEDEVADSDHTARGGPRKRARRAVDE
ncbi:MAG: hypothetical protein M1840_000023 [Geoglossum simile]|nr:MAG: hypothetical protein M1840_000023 [Geoglossum simile]